MFDDAVEVGLLLAGLVLLAAVVVWVVQRRSGPDEKDTDCEEPYRLLMMTNEACELANAGIPEWWPRQAAEAYVLLAGSARLEVATMRGLLAKADGRLNSSVVPEMLGKMRLTAINLLGTSVRLRSLRRVAHNQAAAAAVLVVGEMLQMAEAGLFAARASSVADIERHAKAADEAVERFWRAAAEMESIPEATGEQVMALFGPIYDLRQAMLEIRTRLSERSAAPSSLPGDRVIH
jgi:hypothetical protein